MTDNPEQEAQLTPAQAIEILRNMEDQLTALAKLGCAVAIRVVGDQIEVMEYVALRPAVEGKR